MTQSTDNALPVHIGLILDGNRRWAKAQGLPTLEGHARGQEVLHDIAKHAMERGVRYITAYAFSVENWNRSKIEVSYLMRQISEALKKYLQEFIDNGIRVRIIGSRHGLPASALKSIDEAEAATADCDKATLAVCINYGGNQEIVDATRRIIAEGIPANDVTVERFADYLYAPEVPPIDLLIRTSGEQRLSNFMLWRAAYSELIFRPELWPDFTPAALDECLEEYQQRQRRFGG